MKNEYGTSIFVFSHAIDSFKNHSTYIFYEFFKVQLFAVQVYTLSRNCLRKRYRFWCRDLPTSNNTKSPTNQSCLKLVWIRGINITNKRNDFQVIFSTHENGYLMQQAQCMCSSSVSRFINQSINPTSTALISPAKPVQCSRVKLRKQFRNINRPWGVTVAYTRNAWFVYLMLNYLLWCICRRCILPNAI